MLNGEEVVSAGGMNNTESSSSILLALNRNDEVWLQLAQGKLVEPTSRGRTGTTNFSGFKVGDIHKR